MWDFAGNALRLGTSFLLAMMLAAVLSGVSQLTLPSRTTEGRGSAMASAPWRAMLVTAALAALLAAGAGAAAEVIAAAIVGAALGVSFVRRRDLTRQSHRVVLLGSAMGCAVVCAGFVRFLASTAYADVERVELYVAVFIGALIFAVSTVTWFRLRGALDVRAAVHPGAGIVNLVAFVLCIWLGYGFVTEHAQRFDMVVLLAMSLLAAALGAHVTMNAASKQLPGRCAGLPRHRSRRRCEATCGHSSDEGFDWPDEQFQVLLDDDFAQSCSLWNAGLDASFDRQLANPVDDAPSTVRGEAYRLAHSIAWRRRGRMRVRQRARAARRSIRAAS